MLWSGLLFVNEISPSVFHWILSISKITGAALVAAAIQTVQGFWSATGWLAASLRNPSAPNDPAVWEPALRLALAAAAFACAVLASDEAGRHWIALRPVFVVPLLMGTVVVAFAFDSALDNDNFVEVAGGLVVLWFCFAAVLQVYEAWLGERLDEWWRRKREENELRRRRQEAIDAMARNAASERDRSAAAAVVAAAAGGGGGGDGHDGNNGGGVDDDDECPVCLEPYCGEQRRLNSGDATGPIADEDRVVLPCGHALHASCCRDWLRTSATCPLCRHRINAAGRFVQRLFTVI
jgi:drug/metabolite transporter superfamily protein YnfA